jgi:hypothetical protein
MHTLTAPRPAVKPTRTGRPSAPALALALDAALRRLAALVPDYHRHPARSAARGRWLDRTWWPAAKAADRAERAVLEHIDRLGTRGFVAGGRL